MKKSKKQTAQHKHEKISQDAARLAFSRRFNDCLNGDSPRVSMENFFVINNKLALVVGVVVVYDEKKL